MHTPRPIRARGLAPATYRSLADFRLALRRFLAFSEATATAEGVTAQQYQALLAIQARRPGGLAVKDLAAELLLAPNAAVQLVDRMEREGLVRRTPSPDDRRSVLVALCPVGRRLLGRLAKNHLAELLAHQELLIESLERLRRL